jgi:hypothetical protein
VLYISLSFVLFFWPSARLQFSEEIRRMYFCHKNIHTFRSNHMFIVLEDTVFFALLLCWRIPCSLRVSCVGGYHVLWASLAFDHLPVFNFRKKLDACTSVTRTYTHLGATTCLSFWATAANFITCKKHGILQHKRRSKNMVSSNTRHAPQSWCLETGNSITEVEMTLVALWYGDVNYTTCSKDGT